MHLILVMVSSANGKITAGEHTKVRDWASKEDQGYFSTLRAQSRLLIMGRKTYEMARKSMKLSENTLRMVITKTPERYKKISVQNQLEFTKDSPKNLVRKLEQRGYTEAHLVGGAEINAAFLKAKLVDEFWLTLEPKILGTGKSLVSEIKQNTDLRLKSLEKLNAHGTLLLKYEVARN